MKKSWLVFNALLLTMVLLPTTANAQNGAVCDGIFHWVYVTGAENLDGSETGFEYICQTGSSTGPLLFYVNAGGACWTGDSCDCQPDSNGICTNPNSTVAYGFFNQSTSDDGLPWAQTYWGGGIGAGNPQVSAPRAQPLSARHLLHSIRTGTSFLSHMSLGMLISVILCRGPLPAAARATQCISEGTEISPMI